jgi:hypothetical protein
VGQRRFRATGGTSGFLPESPKPYVWNGRPL